MCKNLGHKPPDVARFERPARVLLQFARQRRHIRNIVGVPTHSYYAEHPPVTVKRRTAAATMSNVLNSSDANIILLIVFLNHKAACDDFL